MTCNMKLAFVAVLFLGFLFQPQTGWSEGWTYEELVSVYLGKENAENTTYGDLGVNEIDLAISEEDLWNLVLHTGKVDQRAEAGLWLLDRMVAGDASRWNELSGFLSGNGLPRSLVAFQTALITSASLLQLEDSRSLWKARDIAQDLFKSRRTGLVVRKMDRLAAQQVPYNLRVLGGKTWVEARGGEQWQLVGNPSLPFGFAELKPGMKAITFSRALSGDMIFLDPFGTVSSAPGAFAWDPENGRVYEILDRGGDKGAGSRSGGSGGSPGNEDKGGDDGDDGNTGGGEDDGDDGSTGGGPGNGNGNEGNPGNGGGNTGGSGPGTGNGGSNNGQGGGSDNGGGGSGNEGNTAGSGDNRSGLGDGTNPGNGGGTENSPNDGTNNPAGD